MSGTFNGTPYTYTDTGHTNPHAVTNLGGTAYTYDNNGNLTNNGIWNHTWDYKNRLIGSSDGGSMSYYSYNPQGERTKLIEEADTTIYPTDSYEIDNGTEKVNINLNNTPVATATGPSIEHLHTDHLGGINIITNVAGNTLHIKDYYPYGSDRIDTGSSNEDKGYTGYTKDTQTGLSYAGARYYDGGVGRFMSLDLVVLRLGTNNKEISLITRDPQQSNTYSYVRNNPIMFTDPSGENLFHGPWMQKGSPYLVPYLETNITVAADNSDGTIFVDRNTMVSKLDQINDFATENNVTLEVFSDYRKDQSNLSNLYVDKAASRSNHMVGQALDYRLIFGEDSSRCRAACIGSNLSPTNNSQNAQTTKGLFSFMKNLGGLRTGDNIMVRKNGALTPDYPHIDTGINISKPGEYDKQRKELENNSSKSD